MNSKSPFAFKLHPLSIVITIVIGGVIVLTFAEALRIEILGGVIGGIVVGIIFVSIPWLSSRLRRFELRFLDPDESITAEHMKRSITVGVQTGKSTVRFSLRPRMGVKAKRISFSAFANPAYPKRLLPQSIGRRISTSEIGVIHLRDYQDNESWRDWPLTPRHGEAFTTDLSLEFTANKRRVFEIEIETSNGMKRWDGILGVQVDYYSAGDLDSRNIHAKLFVRSLVERRPLTFALRGVQRGKPK